MALGETVHKSLILVRTALWEHLRLVGSLRLQKVLHAGDELHVS
jgi:hypothetical protein